MLFAFRIVPEQLSVFLVQEVGWTLLLISQADVGDVLMTPQMNHKAWFWILSSCFMF